jgi:beta-carotene hydroxylase
VFYGFPAFSWIPTHNQNHHRFINGEGDVTSTLRVSHEHTFWNALTFPLLSSYWQAGLLRQFIADARAQRPKLYRTIIAQIAAVVVAHAGVLALMVAAHGFASGSLVYAGVLGLPALFAPWSMMFTNYMQHVGCDPQSRDDHSRNFVSPFWNWLVFDAGYHTVHHEQPGVHWSRYRALHAERAARIAPRLNESSIFAFCFKAYVLGASRPSHRDAARVT